MPIELPILAETSLRDPHFAPATEAGQDLRRESGREPAQGGPSAWFERLHRLLNHDFCPDANRWVYWLKNPFWVLLAATLTALLCGVFVSPAVLILGVGLAVVIVLGVAWPLVSMRGIEGKVRFDHSRCRVGEPILVEIEIRNRWPWPVWGVELVRGFVELSDADQTAGAGIALAVVPGWSTTRVSWPFRPEGRGVYPLATPKFETGFPFGLYRSAKVAAAENELIVWPGSTRLSAMPDAVEIESREDRTSDRRSGDVGDVLGTRWFRQGDSLRRVHWAQSARQGRLIVCERQVPVSCAARLVLDVTREHHGSPGADGSLERLLRVAASLIESLHSQHAYVECVIGHEVHAIGNSSMELRRCLDALALVPREGSSECHTHGLCCGAAKRHRSLDEYVLTTARGFALELHRQHWSDNHRYIVVGAEGVAVPAECAHHEHCGCSPWLELPATGETLTELPRRWARACHAAR
jgi:uncharacterized protein (DUF58 family)